MSALLCTIAAGTVAAAQPLVFLADAWVEDEIVRLADVADLSVLPIGLRGRAASIIVARVRSADQTVSSRDIAARARVSVPALSAWLPPSHDRLIRVHSPATSQGPRVEALATLGNPAVRAGDPITINVRIGPVVVEREVHALQDGQSGRAVFVRTPEGAVLTAQVVSTP